MELAGLEVALGESVSQWGVTGKAWDVLSMAVDFISTVHLGYAELIKQHEIKSNTRESDAIKRLRKQTHEPAACVTPRTVSQQTFSMRGKDTLQHNDEMCSIVYT